jgi:hypothetical protein
MQCMNNAHAVFVLFDESPNSLCFCQSVVCPLSHSSSKQGVIAIKSCHVITISFLRMLRASERACY